MTQSEWMQKLTDDPANLMPAADVPDGSLVILRDLDPNGPDRFGVIMYAAPLTSLAVITGRDVVGGGRVRFTVVSTGGRKDDAGRLVLLAHYITEAPATTPVYWVKDNEEVPAP